MIGEGLPAAEWGVFVLHEKLVLDKVSDIELAEHAVPLPIIPCMRMLPDRSYSVAQDAANTSRDIEGALQEGATVDDAVGRRRQGARQATDATMAGGIGYLATDESTGAAERGATLESSCSLSDTAIKESILAFGATRGCLSREEEGNVLDPSWYNYLTSLTGNIARLHLCSVKGIV